MIPASSFLAALSAQSDERFTPFFFSGYGWVPLVLGLAGIIEVASGRMKRRIEAGRKPAPSTTLLLLLACALFASAIAMGLGLLRQDRALTSWSVFGAVLVLVFLGLAEVVARRQSRGERPRIEEGARVDRPEG